MMLVMFKLNVNTMISFAFANYTLRLVLGAELLFIYLLVLGLSASTLS